MNEEKMIEIGKRIKEVLREKNSKLLETAPLPPHIKVKREKERKKDTEERQRQAKKDLKKEKQKDKLVRPFEDIYKDFKTWSDIEHENKTPRVWLIHLTRTYQVVGTNTEMIEWKETMDFGKFGNEYKCQEPRVYGIREATEDDEDVTSLKNGTSTLQTTKDIRTMPIY